MASTVERLVAVAMATVTLKQVAVSVRQATMGSIARNVSL